MNKNRRDMCSLIAAALPVSLTLAILIPLMALILEGLGYSRMIIGIVTAATPLAIVCTAPWAAWLVHRIGSKGSILIGLLTIAIGILVMGLVNSLINWIFMRFLIGVGLALYLVSSESRLINLAYGRRRGLVIGIYTACLCVGLAAGPLILSQVSGQSFLPFGLCAGLVLLAILALLSINRQDTSYKVRLNGGMWAVVKRAPLAVGVTVSAGMMELAIYSLFPLYSLDRGWSAVKGVMLLAAFSFGGGILQLLIGWGSDKLRPHRLSAMLGLVGCAIPLLLAMFIAHDMVVIILLALWGGAIYGFSVLSLSLLGQTFSSDELAYAYAVMLVIYEVSSALGPVMIGGVMDWLGSAYGFPLALFLVAVVPILTFMFFER